MLFGVYQLFDVIPVSGLTVALLAACVGASLLVWRPLVHRFGWRPGATLAALVAISVVLAITLHPGTASTGSGSLGQCVQLVKQQVLRDLLAIGNDREALVGVAALVPVGFFVMLATGRASVAAATVLILPGVIELAQLKITGRDCNPVDYLASGLGGLLGVGIGLLVHRASVAGRG